LFKEEKLKPVFVFYNHFCGFITQSSKRSVFWPPNMRHLAKFRARRSNICWDMAVFRFSKMAAVRQLRLLKVRNFNFRSGSDTQYASPWQISWRLVKLLRRYGPFSICSRWQPSAILDF